MAYTLHPGAAQDLVDAFAYYRQEAGQAVAERFLKAFEQALEGLAQQPQLGTPTQKGRRSLPLRGFPYTLIYRELQTGALHVLVLRHQRRHPRHGLRRD